MSFLANVNWLDVLIVALLFLGVAVGFFQGLVRQLLGLLTFYISLVLATQYHLVVTRWLGQFFPQALPAALQTISFLLVFLAALVAIGWLASDLFSQTRLRILGIMDELLGGAVSLTITSFAIAVGLLLLRFILQVPWTEYESTRLVWLTALQDSTLAQSLLAMLPNFYQLLRIWVPAGLPVFFMF
ncbi:MAG: CvpA family protein [Chloroflexota bacterium]